MVKSKRMTSHFRCRVDQLAVAHPGEGVRADPDARDQKPTIGTRPRRSRRTRSPRRRHQRDHVGEDGVLHQSHSGRAAWRGSITRAPPPSGTSTWPSGSRRARARAVPRRVRVHHHAGDREQRRLEHAGGTSIAERLLRGAVEHQVAVLRDHGASAIRRGAHRRPETEGSEAAYGRAPGERDHLDRDAAVLPERADELVVSDEDTAAGGRATIPPGRVRPPTPSQIEIGATRRLRRRESSSRSRRARSGEC